MYQEQNNTWRPTTALQHLRLRAKLLANIRQFFAVRNVLEVETPLLSHASTTDPHIASFITQYNSASANSETLYLQTSPEFAMKRLLAAGSGPIYQVCKAFRDEESGRQHNPEFSMLEWYRPGFDHHQLMDEMDAFLNYTLNSQSAERLTYQQAFMHHLEIDPFAASITDLQTCAQQQNINAEFDNTDKDTWLHLLMSHIIEPKLGADKPTFIYDFPASQAALAKIREDKQPVAERFEAYICGIELANGFHELTDAEEQAKRFETENKKRQHQNLPEIPVDKNLLAALNHGIPDCAGIALGIDRLLMLFAKANSIDDVIAFPIERA